MMMNIHRGKIHIELDDEEEFEISEVAVLDKPQRIF